ncbi:16S rRNA (guanine(966)-N(2))-methyltransferase RsmD [Curvivirga aplysinae]|uniref:16S rRNA (guanine(966)-N(2))-methyltransferase RsmD n=1 Tax=Curvivirga aplysinae TaxID=2529852 RepID=UPI0012BD81BB|nr:16S rRNA (guanine(966)-N(2))-methyltransferase RsmD [Curvivirga aplysinae]MTI09449.1 16S rRNA (guanine(966)-N(2))-methyltransferase RsmD [Curvivirga aplysinae]
MRIISGRFKGAKLEAPKGHDTRPTSDRTRESLFNLLLNGKFSKQLRNRPFADIFAGTGAVGLEAISRGASKGYFLENGRHALPHLEANITKCRVEDEARIFRVDASKPPRAPEACGIIFIDPPYGKDLINICLTPLIEKGWLAEDGVVITQGHPADPVSVPKGFEIADERKYGAALLFFLKRIS